MSLGKLSRKARKAKKKNKKAMEEANPEDTEETLNKIEGDNSLEAADFRWKAKMNQLSPLERVRHIALYLLCWGEANQVRFTAECLCFIYKCALDYLDSPLCQQRQEPMPEGDFLNRVITPIYHFIRNQVYEIIDGRFVKRERDHNKIVGYDDLNQLFWYPEGIAKIVLEDGTKLIELPLEERYLRLGDVVWDDVFSKHIKRPVLGCIWSPTSTVFGLCISPFSGCTLHIIHQHFTLITTNNWSTTNLWLLTDGHLAH